MWKFKLSSSFLLRKFEGHLSKSPRSTLRLVVLKMSVEVIVAAGLLHMKKLVMLVADAMVDRNITSNLLVYTCMARRKSLTGIKGKMADLSDCV